MTGPAGCRKAWRARGGSACLTREAVTDLGKAIGRAFIWDTARKVYISVHTEGLDRLGTDSPVTVYAMVMGSPEHIPLVVFDGEDVDFPEDIGAVDGTAHGTVCSVFGDWLGRVGRPVGLDPVKYVRIWEEKGLGRDVLTIKNLVDLKDMVTEANSRSTLLGVTDGKGSFDDVYLDGPPVVGTARSATLYASVDGVSDRIPLICFEEGDVTIPDSVKGLSLDALDPVLKAFGEWMDIVEIRRDTICRK